MRCNRFKVLFSAYLEDELDELTLSECNTHLEQCSTCNSRVKAYQAGVGALRRRPEILPPEDLFERVMDVVANGREKKVVLLRQRLFWVPAAAAAVLAVMFSFSWFGPVNRGVHSMNDLAAVDSTIDLVNVPFMKHYVQQPTGGETVPRARLVSYTPEDEPVLSYGVSRNPDLVMGGAGVVSE